MNLLDHPAIALVVALLESDVKAQAALCLLACGYYAHATLDVSADGLFQVDVFSSCDRRFEVSIGGLVHPDDVWIEELRRRGRL
jgi:hypothetical protein